jgi:hypothetical protein
LAEDELDRVVRGALGFHQRRPVEEASAEIDEIDLDEITGADAVARANAESAALMLHRVPIEATRARLLDRVPLASPVDPVDAAYAVLIDVAAELRRLVDLNAPQIIVREAKWHVQDAFEKLLACARGEDVTDWAPLDRLMTGAPPSGALLEAAEPWAGDALYSEADASVPLEVAFLASGGCILLFAGASVALGQDGRSSMCFPRAAYVRWGARAHSCCSSAAVEARARLRTSAPIRSFATSRVGAGTKESFRRGCPPASPAASATTSGPS